MNIPDSFIADLKARLPLSRLVGRRVKLARAGREWRGLSPFSDEKTPSFYVNDQKGFYYCFSTQERGDIVSFVRKTERLGFAEAVEKLAREAGMELPREPESEEERRRHAARASLRTIVAQAAQFFAACLRGPEGAAARDYLERRGLAPGAWERHHIGYAPPGWRSTLEHLKGRGIDEADIVKAGLAVDPDRGGKPPYDRFRNRVTFTIGDARGHPIAFGGRSLAPEDKPKYINSAENPLFSKKNTLYRFAEARAASAAAPSPLMPILVEGYTDCIAMAEAGFEAAVAPLGTAVSQSQLEAMWRIGSEPIVCLDGDRAGLGAALRILDEALPLLEPQRTLKFASLPEGLDPDDTIRRDGASGMRAILERARPLIEILWERECARAPVDTPERKVDLERRLDAAAERIGDRALRRAYRADLRDRLFVNRVGAGFRARGVSAAAMVPLGKAGPWRRRGQALLARVMDSPALLDVVAESLARIDFADPDLGHMRDAVLQSWEQGGDTGRAAVAGALRDSGFERAAKLVAEPPLMEPVDPASAEGGEWCRVAGSMVADPEVEEEARRSRSAFVSARDAKERREGWDRRRDALMERRRRRAVLGD